MGVLAAQAAVATQIQHAGLLAACDAVNAAVFVLRGEEACVSAQGVIGEHTVGQGLGNSDACALGQSRGCGDQGQLALVIGHGDQLSHNGLAGKLQRAAADGQLLGGTALQSQTAAARHLANTHAAAIDVGLTHGYAKVAALGCSTAGNGAAVEVEGAGGRGHGNTTAVLRGIAAGDGAAIHIHRAANRQNAAVAGELIVFCLAEGAAVDIHVTRTDIHRAALVCGGKATALNGAAACVVADGQTSGVIAIDQEHIGSGCDQIVAVQIQIGHNALAQAELSGANIIRQIIVAAGFQAGGGGQRCPGQQSAVAGANMGSLTAQAGHAPHEEAVAVQSHIQLAVYMGEAGIVSCGSAIGKVAARIHADGCAAAQIADLCGDAGGNGQAVVCGSNGGRAADGQLGCAIEHDAAVNLAAAQGQTLAGNIDVAAIGGSTAGDSAAKDAHIAGGGDGNVAAVIRLAAGDGADKHINSATDGEDAAGAGFVHICAAGQRAAVDIHRANAHIDRAALAAVGEASANQLTATCVIHKIQVRAFAVNEEDVAGVGSEGVAV